MANIKTEVLMMTHLNFYFDLFDNFPYLDRWKNISLFKRVIIVVLIAWFPLVILTLNHRAGSFLLDVSMYTRFLVALPLLLLCPYYIRHKFRDIVFHFVDSEIVKKADRERYFSYVQSVLELRDSKVAKVIIWIVAYCATLSISTLTTSDLSSTWRTSSEHGELTLSHAGMWFSFVSQPIYSFVQFYFVYRVLLWWRLMFLISRMDLQLSASHGDDTGGLIFLSGSIKAFNLPVLALSTSVAAGAMNLVLYKNLAIEDLRFIVIGLILLCMALFIGPLLLFHKQLVRIKREAIFSYGAFGGYQLDEFEKKWLRRSKDTLGSSTLESADFSAVIDATSIVGKVYNMRTFPITKDVLLGFILCIILPFFPVLALKVPWKVIFKQLFELII
jgi:hypothetical protein